MTVTLSSIYFLKSYYKNRHFHIRVLTSLFIYQSQTFYAHLILLFGGNSRSCPHCFVIAYDYNSTVILLHEKLLQFDWLRAVVFKLNLKYPHVKITLEPFAGSSINK